MLTMVLMVIAALMTPMVRSQRTSTLRAKAYLMIVRCLNPGEPMELIKKYSQEDWDWRAVGHGLPGIRWKRLVYETSAGNYVMSTWYMVQGNIVPLDHLTPITIKEYDGYWSLSGGVEVANET